MKLTNAEFLEKVLSVWNQNFHCTLFSKEFDEQKFQELLEKISEER